MQTQTPTNERIINAPLADLAHTRTPIAELHDDLDMFVAKLAAARHECDRLRVQLSERDEVITKLCDEAQEHARAASNLMVKWERIRREVSG